MTTFEDSRTGLALDEGTTRPPWGRVGSGLFYGLLLAIPYGVLSQIIDWLVMKDVPLAVDWNRATAYIISTCVGGLLLGALVAWPHEGWKGILLGAVAIAGWSLLQSVLLIGVTSVFFLPLLLPIVFLSLPISGAVRLAMNLQERAWARYGLRRWIGLLLVVVGTGLLGLFAGSWNQMPAHAQEAVRQVNRILQYAKTNPNSNKGLSVALEDVPEVADHLNSSYSLSQTAVDSSPTGVEVNVIFADGFTMSCLIGQEGDVPYCQQGYNVFSNPGG